MKFTYLLSLMFMMYCLVCSQGTSSNENKTPESVDAGQDFEFEDEVPSAEIPQQQQQQQETTPEPEKPTDDKNTKPGISGFLERMIEGTKRNPLLIALLFAILVKNYLSSGKLKHVEGSLVRHINSSSEWNDLMDESKKEGKFVVVDFFATWCPPCRTAAPKFDQLSIDYGNDANVIFCKVDVDKCSSVAKNSGVTAMPTFMIVKDAKEVDKMKGWSEAGLKDLLVRCGAKKGTSTAALGIKEE